MLNAHLEDLEPTLLWRHFSLLCATPRASHQEAPILARIEHWADGLGLAHERDSAHNLRIRKPASPGFEGAPGIVLQGHVDMVSEADADTPHDFSSDPIETRIEADWLTACGTTLGADNGIGVAAAMAMLEDEALEHGPLEVLLTVAEEVGLVGAGHLAADWIQGKLLLNLDGEQDDEVCIGCAGSAEIAAQTRLTRLPLAANHTVIQVSVQGLQGGHSGLDIASGRANANRLLSRALHCLLPYGLRLVDYDGGRMANALTRSARARVALPAEKLEQASLALAELESVLQAELAGMEDNVSISHDADQAQSSLSLEYTRDVIHLFQSLPCGVERMSQAAPGVVETSNNIGVIQIQEDTLSLRILVRSLVDTARDALVERITSLLALAGVTDIHSASYPSWAPDPESTLLSRFIQCHEAFVSYLPAINVRHAGLECAVIGGKYPDMEMISFGPAIVDAHSPDERVNITSVNRFYDLLRAVINDLGYVATLAPTGDRDTRDQPRLDQCGLPGPMTNANTNVPGLS